MSNKLIALHEWGARLDPPVSRRRVTAIAKTYGKQLNVQKMPGKTGAYLIPEDAPDPRKWTRTPD